MKKFIGFLCAMLCAFPAFSSDFQTAPKPTLPSPPRIAVPPADSAFEDWVRVPYRETAPEIQPSKEESQFGFLLFSRPFVDAIYPETIPVPEERIREITGFGAWDQFQTLNFAIYPLKDLKEINVSATDLVCGEKKIPASAADIRLITYRDITYPMYSSKGAWRRLPEYLQRVSVSDAPAKESQRFCITIKVPKSIAGGIYQGKILISHKDFDRAVVLPIRFEVLPFLPKRDPNKHFSAYYYPPERHELVRNKVHDAAWAEDVLKREFKTMADYGFDRPPVLSLEYTEKDGKPAFAFEKLAKYTALMKENGMDPPFLLTGGGVSWLCEKLEKIKIGNHLVLDRLPSQKYYQLIERLAGDFKKEMEENHYPRMVFGPLDEISSDPKSIEYGCGVYKAFKNGGLTTYTTMEMENPGVKAIDPYIDIYGSQAYLPTYDEIQKGHKLAYWCYPNHNSYERKDPVIMCKGGRMTYGFGYWRSGFDLLVPWIWRNSSSKHFFRERGSGGSNILHPETGEVILTTAWENFREGINDLNYIYTLEDAIVKRSDSADPAVQKEVLKGKALLQEIWDSIAVQKKYLNTDLWPSDEFDGRRYEIGKAILALSKYPESNQKIAPSVIVDTKEPESKSKEDLFRAMYKREAERKNLDAFSLEYPKMKDGGWISTEKEASVDSKGENGALRLLLNVDRILDGTGNQSGAYPSGWPGMVFSFRNGKQYFADYDFARICYRINSNRNSKKGEKLPSSISWLIRTKTKGLSSAVALPDQMEEGKTCEIIAPFTSSAYDGIDMKSGELDHIRVSIAESRYQHGDKLIFTFDRMEFLSLKNPILFGLDLPASVYSKYGRIRFQADLMGKIAPNSQLRADVFSSDGKSLGSFVRSLEKNDKKINGQINLSENVPSGKYRVKFDLLGGDGKVLSSMEKECRVL
ncbi:MAG: hypothetical protein Q4G69_04720 [Planctomycetia bacterium]|nr:hypothetical protein [Planctomycetia bacterium]